MSTGPEWSCWGLGDPAGISPDQSKAGITVEHEGAPCDLIGVFFQARCTRIPHGLTDRVSFQNPSIKRHSEIGRGIIIDRPDRPDTAHGTAVDERGGETDGGALEAAVNLLHLALVRRGSRLAGIEEDQGPAFEETADLLGETLLLIVQ